MEGGQLVTQPVGLWQTYWDSVGNRDYYYNTARTLADPPLVGRGIGSCASGTLTVAVRLLWDRGFASLPRAPSAPFQSKDSRLSEPFHVKSCQRYASYRLRGHRPADIVCRQGDAVEATQMSPRSLEYAPGLAFGWTVVLS